MSTRTYSVTYDDVAGHLALYVDAVLIETQQIERLFPDASVFGPNGIPFLTFGPSTFASYANDEIVLTLNSDINALFGTLESVQIWDRALNASEVATQAFELQKNHSLTGEEDGLALYWRFDRGFGSRIPNLGASGTMYDGILGHYATGVGSSNVYGAGCDTVLATSPSWMNQTRHGNTAPLANNITLQVIEATTAAPTFATIYMTGFDDDGDLLDFAITRLPSHGVLELESTLKGEPSDTVGGYGYGYGYGNEDPSTGNANHTETIWNVTAERPFLCVEHFLRYRLVWWPAENANEPVRIGYKAWDGLAFSAEAVIEVAIQPVDGLPNTAVATFDGEEDNPIYNVTLRVEDVDSDFVSIFIAELPAHGKLYKSTHHENDGWVQGEEIALAYSAWEVVAPIEQFASNVRAVSTFWAAGDDAGNGYPSWHPFQILGPQNSPNYYGESPSSWSPSTVLGDTVGVQDSGDDLISASFDTWASYLSHGFTEYIEVHFIASPKMTDCASEKPLSPCISCRTGRNRTRCFHPVYRNRRELWPFLNCQCQGPGYKHGTVADTLCR